MPEVMRKVLESPDVWKDVFLKTGPTMIFALVIWWEVRDVKAELHETHLRLIEILRDK